LDPLSISVIAERLLHRSQYEISEGDYTLSIICSAMAVESALTQVFLRWKGLDNQKLTRRLASDDEKDSWLQEYRKQTSPGGFEKSVDFVSKFLCGTQFDDFVDAFLQRSNEVALIKAGFPQDKSQLKVSHIQKELFVRRNQIMHLGKLDYQLEDASNALTSALSVFAVLKVMDREKCLAEDQARRESLGKPNSGL